MQRVGRDGSVNGESFSRVPADADAARAAVAGRAAAVASRALVRDVREVSAEEAAEEEREAIAGAHAEAQRKLRSDGLAVKVAWALGEPARGGGVYIAEGLGAPLRDTKLASAIAAGAFGGDEALRVGRLRRWLSVDGRAARKRGSVVDADAVRLSKLRWDGLWSLLKDKVPGLS